MASRKTGTTLRRQPKLRETMFRDPIADVAMYYGFRPFFSPSISREDKEIAKPLKEISLRFDKRIKDDFFTLRPEEKISLLRTCIKDLMQSVSQPLMLCHADAAEHKDTRSGRKRFHLEIIGSTGSIAEALLVRSSLAILEEEGFSNLHVNINSVGDKDSIERFERELMNYYRKHSHSLPTKLRGLLKSNVCDMLLSEQDEIQEINSNAPKPINFLSEPERHHFMEVLEYLESFNVPYSIAATLIGDKNYCSQTMFEIRGSASGDPEESILLAFGTRYNHLSRKMGLRKDIPAIGATFLFNRIGQRKKPAAYPDPKFFFIHIGFEAKVRSLQIIEELRKTKISVNHALTKDKIGWQVAMAEKMRAPYVIIVGQKEALENTAIVRNTGNRMQETIDIPLLPSYLKSLRV